MINGYNLSRKWFEFIAPRKDVKVYHTALYFYIVDLNNFLKWKKEFGLPTVDTMEMLNIGNKKTYLSVLRDIETWGFITIIQESKNQYQSCIISICHDEKATAPTPAKPRHQPQQSSSTVPDTTQSSDPIDKQEKQVKKIKTVKKSKNDSFPLFVTTGAETHVFTECKEKFKATYLEKCGTGEYHFNAVDANKLKSILKKIIFKMKEKKPEASQFENAELINAAAWYFINAFDFGDDWIRSNFNLTNLDSKFNNIYSAISNGKKGNNKTGKRSNSGASNQEIISAIYGRNKPGDGGNN